jgi:hypothetical protein
VLSENSFTSLLAAIGQEHVHLYPGCWSLV